MYPYYQWTYGETKQDMLETVKQISKHPVDAIKIHMLHLIEGTQMAKEYEKEPFHILTLERICRYCRQSIGVITPRSHH